MRSEIYAELRVVAGSIKVPMKSITLPDATPGIIIEYRYKIQRDPEYICSTSQITPGTIQYTRIYQIN
jgi:hypothetical protein